MAIVYLPGRTPSLIERIAYGILALVVVILGFFFLAAAVVAGLVLAGVVVVRYWWWKRRLRKAAEDQFLTTEYSVVERDTPAGPEPGGTDRR